MPAITFTNVQYGKRNGDVTLFQKMLLAKGHGIPSGATGYYGDQTKKACMAFQRAQGWTGKGADGLPGPSTFARLGFTNKAPKPGPPPSGGAGEPAHNYGRTTYGGRTVNQRTKVMLQNAAGIFGANFGLTQGSYNKGVSASAGTHDGGGVVDISVGNISGSRRAVAVQALRKAGFAAWLRTPSQGMSYHIHACAIGDREMAGAAKSQVRSYFNGRNGLAGNGVDTNPPRPWPAWASKYR